MTPELREKLNYSCIGCYKGNCSVLEHEVDAAIQAEREACAKIAEDPSLKPKYGDDPIANSWWGGRVSAAGSIRSRRTL